MNDICFICKGHGADKYTWCRPCIKRAARGAARHFISTRMLSLTLDDVDLRTFVLRRETNRWEKRFKRKLKRRGEST